MKLSQQTLKELFTYDVNTGWFTRFSTNDISGTIDARGYVKIKIDGKIYAAHRLAWLYIVGCWPADEIDHINGIRHDNRFINLREANHNENMRNRKLNENNSSEYKGVHWHKNKKKWMANIRVEGRKIYLGSFDTAIEASQVYETAAKKYFDKFVR